MNYQNYFVTENNTFLMKSHENNAMETKRLCEGIKLRLRDFARTHKNIQFSVNQ